MTRPTVSSRPRGFTLLEALVAGGIFFVSVLAISLLSVHGMNNASKGMRYAQASRVATQELENWSMRRFLGLQTFIGANPTPMAIPQYVVTDGLAGSARQYLVNVTIYDTSGAPGTGPLLPGGFPSPNIGAPSYFLYVQVNSIIPNSPLPVTVTESTYVSN
ncbi:MAG TPA: hypothetical protein VLT82_00995 [Myxococcaceae bacterium]|nr:hypothetical protein [Myxococcaceae bacterium]